MNILIKNYLEDMRAYQMDSYDFKSREDRLKKPMSKIVAFIIIVTIIAIGYAVSLQYSRYMNYAKPFVYVY